MSSDTAVDVEKLVKRFGNVTAVDGLDLVVPRGEIHGFLGPNGAGKSTTIRVLLGLYRASAGRVRVLGLDPSTHAADLTRRVSYVPGDVRLWPNLTGQEVLDALAGLRGRRRDAVQARLIDAFSLDTRKVVRSYSKGNRQKVILVAAFAADTELLVLDEPTSGLDPLMEELFQQCVREAADDGRTVLLSSHILAEVERLCRSVTIIKDGRLVESGRLDDLRHLEASAVSARIGDDQVTSVFAELAAVCPGLPARPEPDVALSVPRLAVPGVLGVLARAEARDIVCAPASLEDLFLRHYQVAR